MQPNGKGETRVGVLAVQGDFEAHARALVRVGATAVLVKHPGQIGGVEGLVLPGGESTTMLKFLEGEGLLEPIRHAAEGGMPVFGTCAGAILMARQVTNPSQVSLDLMDITIRRNGYGRQTSSFITRELWREPGSETDLEMVFIRAPIIERAGPSVRVLAGCRGTPVLVRQSHLVAATFHPELTSSTFVHRYFLEMIKARAATKCHGS